MYSKMAAVGLNISYTYKYTYIPIKPYLEKFIKSGACLLKAIASVCLVS